MLNVRVRVPAEVEVQALWRVRLQFVYLIKWRSTVAGGGYDVYDNDDEDDDDGGQLDDFVRTELCACGHDGVYAIRTLRIPVQGRYAGYKIGDGSTLVLVPVSCHCLIYGVLQAIRFSLVIFLSCV